MNQYVCSICGYVYEETKGIPEEGYVPGTVWEDIPDTFTCPLCGASKSLFDLIARGPANDNDTDLEVDTENLMSAELSTHALSALFSNLSKGCEKQYRPKEQALFERLSVYFKKQDLSKVDGTLEQLSQMIDDDINISYKSVLAVAKKHDDRGAMRALGWSEKVTRMEKSVLSQYTKASPTMLAESNTYVCEICGFIYRGDEAPDICPVCKVPKMKLTQVKG